MPTPIRENRLTRMRKLTGGSDIAYIVSAGRADAKQLPEPRID